MWDGNTRVHIASLEGYSDTLSFSPDGSRLAPLSGDAVRLWDGITGLPIATLECHSGHTYALSFCPDGSQLVSGSRDGTVRLWDGAAGLHIATLKDHSEPVGAFKLSSLPDSSRLADHGRTIP